MKDFNYRRKRNGIQDEFSTENYMRHHREHNKIRGLLIGFLLIIAGTFVIAYKMNYISEYLYNIVISWQMLLIAIGLVQFSRKGHYIGGTVLLIIGTVFLIPNIISIPNSLQNLSIPAILIAIGLLIILKNIFKSPQYDSFPNLDISMENDSADYINEKFVFSGRNINVTSQNFKGGKVESVFGGGKINLMDADLSSEGKNILEFNLVFGAVEIIVPRDWNVIIKTNSVFGGFTEKNNVLSNQINPDKELIIVGKAVFGGGEIKRY